MKTALSSYFANYVNTEFTSNDKLKIEDITIDSDNGLVVIYLNDAFGCQPFSPHRVKDIYRDVSSTLPSPLNTYQLSIITQGVPIERLVPIHLQEEKDSTRLYPRPATKAIPWVTPMSLPYKITNGLQGRHLCVWASHGKYYRNTAQEWVWQRPRLFCTSEDLFTQTIVIPYLIPMLENSGAVVYTPRERDWQKCEVVVDNDNPSANGVYTEQADKYKWEDAGIGFAHVRDYYMDLQNPFEEGSCRKIDAVSGKKGASNATWMPLIPEDGDYAVYVSYKTLPNSVPDATYTVIHQGESSSFRVNQQMGGSTWVYLGTFAFSKGQSARNCVRLSNSSNYRGVITADAVRFGGGMSNIARMDSTMSAAVGSGLPRCLEAARYTAMWSGIPSTVYAVKDNDDYGDDINTRPLSLNYVARGSEFVPGDSGLCVPVELSLAVHSDAGYKRDANSLIGSLGIYTTDADDGRTAAGLSRLTSRDLNDIVLSQVTDDISRSYGSWNRRQMYNRNYGETRVPQVPSMILETLSHQNFGDMRLGLDPNFRFLLARSIYKGVARYLHIVHQTDSLVIQPLPVRDLSAIVEEGSGRVFLNWLPTEDEAEPSAKPSKYVVYTSVDDGGFDNGTVVPASQGNYVMEAKPGVLYRFKVAALNEGGRSALSDEVCALYAGANAQNLLVVDNFQRISGPQSIDNDTIQGFLMDVDPGVIDRRSPGFCGYQVSFSKKGFGKEGPGGLGYSGSELEGMILAGNTHDYSTRHARDIMPLQAFNISSCVGSAMQFIKASHFRLIDIIFGAQRFDESSPSQYKTFTPQLRSILGEYASQGGNILVSGAFVGCDMQAEEERSFTSSVLKYAYSGSIPSDSIPSQISGMNQNITIYENPNERNFWVRSTDVISPCGDAFSAMVYMKGGQSAAVAYKGSDYRAISFGFPLECIMDEEARRSIIQSSVQFLTTK